MSLPWFPRSANAPRIEPLHTAHAGRLAAIHADAFARPWSPLEFERLLADALVVADGLFLGRETEPMGFALSRRVVDEAELLTTALVAEARGRGLSRVLLLRHLEELAFRRVRIVHLEVEEGNAPALALYRRLGFREVGRREGYYLKPDGSRATAIAMSVSL